MLLPAQQLAQLRTALAGSHEAPPRPVVDLELPPLVQKAFASTLKFLRPAAVLVPLLQRPHELTVLLTVRAAHLRKHSGQISFPGGRRDDGDASLVDCALREAQEEVGLAPSAVEVLGFLSDYPTVSRYLVTPVVGLIRQPPEFKYDPQEVAEVFEVPLAVFAEPSSFARKSFHRDGLNVPFFEVQHGPHRIWGATAGMLWELCQKLNAPQG